MKKGTKETLLWGIGLAVLAALVAAAWKFLGKTAAAGPKTAVKLAVDGATTTSTVDVPADSLERYKKGTATLADFEALGKPFAAEVVANWLRLNYMGQLSTSNPYLGDKTAMVLAANQYLKNQAGKPSGWPSVQDYLDYVDSIMASSGHPGLYAVK